MNSSTVQNTMKAAVFFTGAVFVSRSIDRFYKSYLRTEQIPLGSFICSLTMGVVGTALIFNELDE